MTLREVLHAHIPTLDAQSTVRDAVDKMDLYQFPALVVLTPSRVPMAVVTEGDLCRAASTAGSLSGIAYLPAYRFGTREPITAPADTEISEAFHLMLARGLTILPVMDDETLAGVVLRCDLMHAMLVDSEPESPPV
ncbi:MAG: CBS domain-containing protein [Fimbriimonadales bacterium]|nr:CBS domain-containing protein [Fimbriimonadales bacterium]